MEDQTIIYELDESVKNSIKKICQYVRDNQSKVGVKDKEVSLYSDMKSEFYFLGHQGIFPDFFSEYKTFVDFDMHRVKELLLIDFKSALQATQESKVTHIQNYMVSEIHQYGGVLPPKRMFRMMLLIQCKFIVSLVKRLLNKNKNKKI